VEEIEENRRGWFRCVHFSYTKLSLFWGTQTLYWMRVLGVLDGLYEFFKFNLCSYNILKIKNILIISVKLSFSNKLLFQKIQKILRFSFRFSILQSLPFSPTNSQTYLRGFDEMQYFIIDL